MPQGQGMGLRVVVDIPTRDADFLTALRILLLADILTRFAETLQKATVTITYLGGSPPSTEMIAVAGALGICERVLDATPTRTATWAGAMAPSSGGDLDLLLTRAESGVYLGPPACRLTVKTADLDGWDRPSDLLSPGVLDPLALRLALLRCVPSEPARVSRARVNRAEETLQRWRSKVADWRDLPPGRVPETSAVIDRHLADLNTRAVLILLHRLETDHTVASGAKFNVFTSTDRVLALDLGRLIGKPRH